MFENDLKMSYIGLVAYWVGPNSPVAYATCFDPVKDAMC